MSWARSPWPVAPKSRISAALRWLSPPMLKPPAGSGSVGFVLRWQASRRCATRQLHRKRFLCRETDIDNGGKEAAAAKDAHDAFQRLARRKGEVTMALTLEKTTKPMNGTNGAAHDAAATDRPPPPYLGRSVRIVGP